MAWEENSRICLHMQLIAILSRIGVKIVNYLRKVNTNRNKIKHICIHFVTFNYSMKHIYKSV